MTFTLGAVLTVLSGKLLCDMDEVYRILNHMTGESLFTHQLPRAARVCEAALAQQHPDLALLDWSGVTPESWRQWLAETVEMWGPTREVKPLPTGFYEAQDPIAELVEMRGGNADNIIVVEA